MQTNKKYGKNILLSCFLAATGWSTTAVASEKPEAPTSQIKTNDLQVTSHFSALFFEMNDSVSPAVLIRREAKEACTEVYSELGDQSPQFCTFKFNTFVNLGEPSAEIRDLSGVATVDCSERGLFGSEKRCTVKALKFNH